MRATFATCQTVLALDVGRRPIGPSWPRGPARSSPTGPSPTGSATSTSSSPRAPEGTLVVVDQKRNVGALALRRARMAGLAVGYLPGLAAHEASKLFAGDAKTDARDAMVIAKTALGVPDALLPAPEGDPRLRRRGRWPPSASTWSRARPGTRTGCAASCSSRAPRSRRSPTSPDPHWLDMLASLGGPWDPRRREGLARRGHARREQGRRSTRRGRPRPRPPGRRNGRLQRRTRR